MKYLSTGGFQRDPLMKLTLGLALLLLAGFWATNVALYFVHMNLDPASVVSYYNGNEAEFHPARSAQSMLEVTHMHLPMFALVLLLLTHLLIFAPMRNGVKIGFIVGAFGSALLFEAAGWMTRFWHPGFAALKVSAFVVFQAMLAYLIVGLALYLVRGGPRASRRGTPVREPAGLPQERALGAAATPHETVPFAAAREPRPRRPEDRARHQTHPPSHSSSQHQ